MRALAVCQDELVIRTLHRVLAGAFDIEFLVESRPLARRLVDDGIPTTVADPKRVDSYLRADLTPNTCVIVEDNARRGLKRILTAIRDSTWSVVYLVLFGVGTMIGMMLITAALAVPFAWSAGRFDRVSRGLRLAAGALSVVFGLAIAWRIGIVDGLFGSAPRWDPR